MEELLEFYNKPDEKSFRDEMYEINKGNKLASEMQQKIISDLGVLRVAASNRPAVWLGVFKFVSF